MEMRKTYVYLIIALMLSLLLTGCADSTENGVVSNSPRPAVTEPVIPMPTAMVTAAPTPNVTMDHDMAGAGTEKSPSDTGSTGTTGTGTGNMSTSSPAPTDNSR